MKFTYHLTSRNSMEKNLNKRMKSNASPETKQISSGKNLITVYYFYRTPVLAIKTYIEKHIKSVFDIKLC